jgi:dihydroorotate dehydrogenase
MTLPNPVGLAAGFDKNAEAIAPLSRRRASAFSRSAPPRRGAGGNARPRLFRLTEDAAAINRFGFNNDGMEDRRAARRAPRQCPWA